MRINAFIPYNGRWKVISIFGYTTKGIPGIEIKGMGKEGLFLKEKLIYLTRLNKIKMPLNRFVICIDLHKVNKVSPDESRWLELPLLILFWHMIGVLPIGKLDDCFVAGTVSSSGTVKSLPVKENFLIQLNTLLEKNYQMKMKYLNSSHEIKKGDICTIPLSSLFSGKNITIRVS